MQFFTRRKSDKDEKQEQARGIEHVPQRPMLSQQAIGFETVLGPSSVLEGKLKSDGNIRMDGTFTGELDITGNVLIGENGEINADIDANNISIAGAVRGNVSGNKVQLLRTARVWGDISASALTTEEGAFIDGKISMRSGQPDAVAEMATVSTEMTTSVDVGAGAADDDEEELEEVEATLVSDDEVKEMDKSHD